MVIEPSDTCVRLERRQPVSLQLRPGTRLTATRGAVWVTIDHDRRDLVLDAGEQHLLTGAEPVLVSALSEQAWLCVCEPALPRPGHAGARFSRHLHPVST